MRSAFGELVAALCTTRGISPRALALATGVKSESLATYYLRSAAPGRKGVRPPLVLIERWADYLQLTGDERVVFIRTGALEHCPQVIRDYVRDLETQVGALGARRSRRRT